VSVVIPKEPYPCKCLNCGRSYDLSLQFALCPHETRESGIGADSRPPFGRNFYPFYGHDDGLVITQPKPGEFVERQMTQAELKAREPARQIALDIYRHANYAAVCYAEIWHLISIAAQEAIDAERIVARGGLEREGDVKGRNECSATP
jgi:hypothetical protein